MGKKEGEKVWTQGGERKEKEEKKYPELPGFFRWL